MVSALYYDYQLRSLLVGYNFGAFQIWNLDDLKLCFTSSIHKEHIPVSNFTMQVRSINCSCLSDIYLLLSV